jgi:N-acetylmuramoyl-L-alanine amidase
MSKTKVALVVGHDRLKQGAWGNAGMSEWGFNSEVAKRLERCFESDRYVDIKVFYHTPSVSYGKKMKKTHKAIDAWGAKYAIELHFNAAGDLNVTGHEVLYCSSAGEKIAKKLDMFLNRHLRNKDRKIKHRSKKQRGGGFLCRGKSVCLISEPFFAAHQDRFVPGTLGWDSLISAYIEFISYLGGRDVGV